MALNLKKQLTFHPVEKLYYLAGIVDGEGCLYTFRKLNGRNKRYKTYRIIVTNTNLELIKWIANNFGGYIVTMKKEEPHYKQCYQWLLDGPRAIMLISELAPLLIVKREKASKILNA